ncbi:MAG: methyltransferase domain-containing protein [bacterium]|nr:methyltransferase domain-containing protein [bacterium]
MDKIEDMGTAPGLHHKVLKMIAQEKTCPTSCRRGGRVLDAPAGRGKLSFHLREMGFEVWAGDIEEKVFEPKDIKFQKLDLNERLPYPDSFFTYIVCVEGIEHLMNVYQLF